LASIFHTANDAGKTVFLGLGFNYAPGKKERAQVNITGQRAISSQLENDAANKSSRWRD
jgi:hypothetical protein